jgi:hypothetical protein
MGRSRTARDSFGCVTCLMASSCSLMKLRIGHFWDWINSFPPWIPLGHSSSPWVIYQKMPKHEMTKSDSSRIQSSQVRSLLLPQMLFSYSSEIIYRQGLEATCLQKGLPLVLRLLVTSGQIHNLLNLQILELITLALLATPNSPHDKAMQVRKESRSTAMPVEGQSYRQTLVQWVLCWRSSLNRKKCSVSTVQAEKLVQQDSLQCMF